MSAVHEHSIEPWPAALTIAGSDSGGGAGIQADLKTFAALGVFGTSAITAVTAQNTYEVRAVQVMSPEIVVNQIRAVYDDIRPRAAKTGMLANTGIVLAVCATLDDIGDLPVVVDPVAFTSTGTRLLTDDAFEALRDQLVPRSTLVTPNLREAAALAGIEISSADDMLRAAHVLLERGARAVLVKGGHSIGDANDLFLNANEEVWLYGEHIETTCTHGTGCSLSAATAAGLALGLPLLDAVRRAKQFVTEGIRQGYVVGKGHSPINHFHQHQRKLEGEHTMTVTETTIDKPLVIGGKEFTSRLMLGTGKYRTHDEMVGAFESSGTQIITVALRRIDFDDPASRSVLENVDWSQYQILPNTAGCATADEAIRIARLARSMGLSDWIKLEVIPDPKYLFPDPVGTLEAAEVLVQEGFTVLPYISDDPVLAARLEAVGCATVMPLAAPIGSGQGLVHFDRIKIIIEQSSIPVVVDAGIGAPSDASLAMELGADACLVNSAIALAERPVDMARAMAMGVEAGRIAYLAGRMPKRQAASASSPTTGIVQ